MRDYPTKKNLGLLSLILMSSMAWAAGPTTSITAGEQVRGSKADVEITRKVREAIMDKDGLSTYAQNVKIVTLGGVVVLRGPVRSQDEKTLIGRLAQSIAGSGKVRNDIEVSAR
jgi:hyperosmotically inducible protein